MNEQQTLEFLGWTGHLEYAHGVKQQVPTGPFSQAIKTAEAIKAVASFQEFEAERMDRLSLIHHGRSARFDGDIGPATIEAMQTPRCRFPDYGPNVAAAIGNGGGWVQCHGSENHCVTIYEDKTHMPSFLEPHYAEICERFRAMNADIGIEVRWVENRDEANIVSQWDPKARGWIGLAIVGRAESCTSQIWAKFDPDYRPANIVSEWTTLKAHEHCHNWGLSHSRGGIMNPSIVQGLAPTWRGDPSEPLLVRMYGGEPVDGGPGEPGKECWTHMGRKSNKGRTVWAELPVPEEVET